MPLVLIVSLSLPNYPSVVVVVVVVTLLIVVALSKKRLWSKPRQKKVGAGMPACASGSEKSGAMNRAVANQRQAGTRQ